MCHNARGILSREVWRSMSRSFLGLTDWKTSVNLFANENVSNWSPEDMHVSVLKQQEDLIIFIVDNLLSSEECGVIAKYIAAQSLEPMSEKYPKNIRDNSRLLVFDKDTSEMLWKRLERVVGKQTLLSESLQLDATAEGTSSSGSSPAVLIPTRPLGFGVGGVWDVAGLNPALRLNVYRPGEKFALHKDSQYAAHGDERSVLSLILYISDDFEAGETEFYFPTAECTRLRDERLKSGVGRRDLTVDEEVQEVGGLMAFERVTVKPRRGQAVLFSHNLLHCSTPHRPRGTPDERGLQEEGVIKKKDDLKVLHPPVLLDPSWRVILRSDLVVRRLVQPLGFSITPKESDDYYLALQYFRDAQRAEMEHKKELADELYQRSLAFRYSYPRTLRLRGNSVTVDDFPPHHPTRLLPGMILFNFLFLFLPFYPDLQMIFG